MTNHRLFRYFFVSDGDRKQRLEAINPETTADEVRGTPEAPLVLGMLVSEGLLSLASRFFERLVIGGSGEESGLPPNATDAGYLNAMSCLTQSSVVAGIREANTKVFTEKEFDLLVDDLYGNLNAQNVYIDKKTKQFCKRYKNEYSLFHGLTLNNLYPYKYLTDYSFKSISSSNMKELPKSITFIYCIKNRVKRTTISIQSLERSYSEFRKNIGDIFQINVVIVEDISDDILDISAIQIRELDIDHFIVNTGVGWSRSGLLNYGIKRTSSEILAFVDADFLFSPKYIESLWQVFNAVKWREFVFASNLIETEAHHKGKHLYSSATPYSYLWMAPADIVNRVDGFDEGYTGHGFEDRDFELKLTRLGGLTVTDTVSINPDCFVLHLSHVVRDGIERQVANKNRYMMRIRMSADSPATLGQPVWGEQKLVKHIAKRPGEPVREIATPSGAQTYKTIDFLFVPHNGYHVRASADLVLLLEQAGYRCRIANISPPHPDEGVPAYPGDHMRLDALVDGSALPRCIVVFNDWENLIVRHLIQVANQCGVETIGIVEGVNDFNDVDTGKQRSAYRRVNTVILNGDFDRRYFSDSSQNIFVGGVQRLDRLINQPLRVHSVKRLNRDSRPLAVINANFSYGVLAVKREDWLKGAIEAAKAAGYRPIVSQHIADAGPLYGAVKATSPLYELFDQADVVISRFSGVILEALAASLDVAYYNPDTEKIDKFSDPKGAYHVARSPAELITVLKRFKSGERCDPSEFLRLHCDIHDWTDRSNQANSSLQKTARILTKRLEVCPEPRFHEFVDRFRSEYLKKSRFVPAISDDTRQDLVLNVTFGIKSFGRTTHLRRLLESILKVYPSAKIIIVDDSEEADLDLPPSVLLIKSDKEDIGLSAGRNMLIDACDTEYFVLLDDDFIFTDKTEIELMLQTLKSYDLDIVGGVVYDVGPSAQKKDQPRIFYGSFEFENDGIFKISTGRISGWQTNAPLFDLVLNFFVAKTASLRRVRWTDEYKLGEHLDFFIRARDANLKISYVEKCVVNHYRDHSANTEEYKAYRRRADAFHEKFRKHYKIKQILLNSEEIPG